jgi:O-antigen ligase
VSAELARAFGLVAALGLAALAVAPSRLTRMASLVVTAVGGAGLAVYLAPDTERDLLAVPAVVLGAGLVAVVLRRRPWLLPVGTLAAAPVRIPVDLGDQEANLLLPLYALVAGAGLVLGWEIVRGDRRARELGPLAWPFAAFVAWCGVSLLWTDDVEEGAIALLAFYLPFGLLALALARLEWNRRWLTFLYAQLVAMAVLFAGIGVYQWLTRDVFWNPKVIVGNAYAPFYRVNSVFWDPSIYGRFLVVAILAALVVVLYGSEARASVASAAAIVVTWAGLVFSFSQSSYVALVVGVLAAALLALQWRAVVALGLAVLFVVAAGFAAPATRKELERGVDKATSGRYGLVEEGIGIARDRPLTGAGLGAFKVAYAERTGLRGRDPAKAASHTTPVTVAAELGAPGVALFAWLLVAALMLPVRRASRSFAGRASLIFGLILTAILVHSLFYNAFFEDPLTWAALGLGSMAYRWRTSA